MAGVADSPLEFPCEFPIKAMGRSADDLADVVWGIVSRHAPETPADALRTKASRHGRYVSVTVTITARSRTQLDTIYQDLQSHGDVLATL